VELNAGHLSLPGPALISLVERDFRLGISISHCPQLVAVAIGKGRLGLDCEAMGKIRNWQALADHFFTQEGGSVKAVGMGQGVIGFGAGKLRPEFGGCISIDDPIKAQDGRSKTVRERCNRDYHTSFESRRNRKDDPMTPIVVIMQRLHPGDLAGHLLATERHRWTVVQIPAIDENGESIWPERISLKELEHMREYDPETYFSQYMQQPSDAAYSIFKNSWWRFWTNISEVEKRITLKIIVADTAFKEQDSSDYSVFQCWGFESSRAAYLLDQVRGKWEFPELVNIGRDFLKKHTEPRYGITPAKYAYVEDKASGTSLVQTLRREGLKFQEWLPPHSDQRVLDKSQVLRGPDKVSRCKQCTIPIASGRILLPYPRLVGYKWVENYVQEHSAMSMDDSHLYDDQVDGTTMALLIWQQMGGGAGELPKLNKVLTWDDYLSGVTV
jgi:predicted phage terminase large subunit-like protein